MTEIPEHLLQRSRAAREKATGESASSGDDAGASAEAPTDDDGVTKVVKVGPEFEVVAPDLKDVYFAALKGHDLGEAA